MKPDSQEIKEFLEELASQSWLGGLRSSWVPYSFHFSDILNAVEILKSGKILCRAELEAKGCLPLDIASPEIISGTDQAVKDSVRLYFRPRTPTQYHNEGFRPSAERSRNSHCPMPVFFLFDSWEILSREDSKFSERNLAIFGRHQLLCSTAVELRSFNFKNIYHTGEFPRSRRNEIIGSRNAEIVIPKELDLSSLRYICCRSAAEKETLLQLLPSYLVDQWGSRILVDSQLYNREWVFIETVSLSSTSATFQFSPDPKVAGPFDARITVRGNREIRFRNKEFLANKRVPVKFPHEQRSYIIEFYLDDHVAYSGSYDSRTEEIPF